MNELEAIVRAIVDPAKWVYDGYVCMGCKSLVHDEKLGTMDEPHDDDCPFGRAIAWVEANPA